MDWLNFQEIGLENFVGFLVRTNNNKLKLLIHRQSLGLFNYKALNTNIFLT